jgi:hypothetical protein
MPAGARRRNRRCAPSRSSSLVAVELEQIEGPQERPAVVLAAVQAIEIGDAIVITHRHLAVDRRVRAERGRSRYDQRIAVAPVVAAAGEEAHANAAPADDQPIAVVLDFVNPLRPYRDLIGARRDAGLDEAHGAAHRRRPGATWRKPGPGEPDASINGRWRP